LNKIKTGNHCSAFIENGLTLNTQSEAKKGYRVLVLISNLPSFAGGENGKDMMAAALFFLYTVQ
jgi:hypothetical protein